MATAELYQGDWRIEQEQLSHSCFEWSLDEEHHHHHHHHHPHP